MAAPHSSLLVDGDDAERERLTAEIVGAGFSCRGVATGEQAVALAESLRPPVVMSEVALPGTLRGFEVCSQIRARHGCGTRIALWSAPPHATTDRRVALFLGADAFLEKPLLPGEILVVFALLASRYLSPPPPVALTEREREVAALVVRGIRNREIADALGISPSTVSVHVHRILQKASATSRTQLLSRLYDSMPADYLYGEDRANAGRAPVGRSGPRRPLSRRRA